MADKRISQLDRATLTTGDALPILRGTSNYSVVLSDSGTAAGIGTTGGNLQTVLDGKLNAAGLSGTGGAASIGTAAGVSVEAALASKATASTFSVNGGAALIGTAAGVTVETALGQKAVASTLAAAGGAALIGTAGGITVEAALALKASTSTLALSSGSSGIGFLQSGTGASSRTVQAKLRETVSPQDFGAVGDGSTDDTAAINKFLAAVAAGAHGVIPLATYKFTSALTCAAANNIEISGRGEFVYTGASTTIDLLTIGSTSTQSVRLRIQGLRMSSTTTMTAGTALKLNKVFRSTLRDIILDGQDGTGNFWNGLWFNGCDVNTIDGFQFTAANDALRINDGSDIFLDNGKIAPADNPTVALRGIACGFRVGGGFGGTQIGAVDIIGCATNMIVDNTLSATANREITFSSLAALDTSATGPNLYLNETSGSPVYVASNGWFASAKTHNIEIASSTSAYHIILAGGRVYNTLTGDGIRNNAVNSIIQCTGVEILNNAGYGVNNPGGSFNVTTMGCTISGNGSGDKSGIVMDPVRTLVATCANGGSVAIPGSAGMVTITLADGGAHSGVYVFGGGGAAMLGASNPIFVASTTTPAAGKVSFAYSGSSYNIYNNSGSAIRMQAIVSRTS